MKDQDRVVYTANRREVLIKGVAGALAVAGFWSRTGTVFAAVPGVTNGETPGLTEGPYWVDDQLNRVDIRLDTSTNTYSLGLPLYLGLTISQLSDTPPYTITPLVGARVDVWHCNAQGFYSDEAIENTTGMNFNRGYQVTNAHGVVQFLTIYPGWYSGRTPHIHIRIRTYDTSGTVVYNYTSQLFFDDAVTNTVYKANAAYARPTARDTTNATDNILNGASQNNSPATEAGDYTLLKLADDGDHAVGTFHFVIDLSDTANADPTGGSETGGGGGGTPPGGGGPPPGGGGPPPGGVAPAAATFNAGTSQTSTKANVRAAAKAKANAAAKAKAAAQAAARARPGK